MRADSRCLAPPPLLFPRPSLSPPRATAPPPLPLCSLSPPPLPPSLPLASRSVDPFLRKEWYDIKAPNMFSSRVPGKTPVTKTTGTSA